MYELELVRGLTEECLAGDLSLFCWKSTVSAHAYRVCGVQIIGFTVSMKSKNH